MTFKDRHNFIDVRTYKNPEAGQPPIDEEFNSYAAIVYMKRDDVRGLLEALRHALRAEPDHPHFVKLKRQLENIRENRPPAPEV